MDMRWNELRRWAKQALDYRLPAMANQSAGRALGIREVGTGQDRDYGFQEQCRLYGHVVWSRIAGRTGPGGAQLLEEVRRSVADYPAQATVALDGEVDSTTNPEAWIRLALTTPYGFAAIKPAASL